ncbi:hypothetical protein CUN38_04975 [Enterococcus faecium]|uniref:hypothetical protein n=1 Tax=Enterococcus faecium TaxID=1352 RepID=UPI000CF057D7|nr:hypothetical protein [Enterococcus faecium]PQC93497.1 hypothetical protein CUN38_04975 [Enterococcus faecium]
MLKGMMTGKEYSAIVRENGLVRSPTVRILEEQVAILNRHAEEAVKRGDLTGAQELQELAEVTKWECIELMEVEKAQGYSFITD